MTIWHSADWWCRNFLGKKQFNFLGSVLVSRMQKSDNVAWNKNILAFSHPVTSQRVIPVQSLSDALETCKIQMLLRKKREQKWDIPRGSLVTGTPIKSGSSQVRGTTKPFVLLPAAHKETRKSISNESLGTRDRDSPWTWKFSSITVKLAGCHMLCVQQVVGEAGTGFCPNRNNQTFFTI